MKLYEAKRILKENGYMLKESSPAEMLTKQMMNDLIEELEENGIEYKTNGSVFDGITVLGYNIVYSAMRAEYSVADFKTGKKMKFDGANQVIDFLQG